MLIESELRMNRDTELRIRKKRLVLIVEDNELNREILTSILEDEYDIITAENGEEGIKLLSDYYKEISVVLLDVYMPVCNGFDFLVRVKNDELLSQVPVIVTTGSDKPEDEVKCLDLGASDFVTKPYNSKIVLGRTRSIIRLHESVAALSIVEYDYLTGVFTMPAFYHHAEKLLKDEQEKTVDLIVADLQEFKLVNGLFGEKVGDDVLRYIGRLIGELIPSGLVARQGDKFFCMFPADKRLDEKFFYSFKDRVTVDAPVSNINIKFGYYPDVDKSFSPSILCDRVVMAASVIKKDFTRCLVYYDDMMSEKLVDEQRMESDFDSAIDDHQFAVWFQPKIDADTEELVAAEALVRWVRPDGTIIPPGKFIPLFEKDGLISTLDTYVFKRVCHYQKERIDMGKKVFPISVNLSRNSIYHKNMAKHYRGIVDEIDIPAELVPLELTESAATGGYGIELFAGELVDEGFVLHMDDFGAGYSSLSSLCTLPFSDIKLDKTLIDQIGTDKGEIIVKHTIGIAHEMGLQVVAEGVENAEQLEFLRNMSCDIIQGFYYSAPLDSEKFNEFVTNVLKRE